LANYGEYSGAPSEQQTYEYAKTILSLMTKEKNPTGKILIIGGGIANFTNVAATFKVNSKGTFRIRFNRCCVGHCQSITRIS
jgi:succinyl-CoA synthetase beta subunit